MDKKVIMLHDQRHAAAQPAQTLPQGEDLPLPEAFASLQPFVTTWALATETERNIQRHTAGMPSINAFKDAILPQADTIEGWLNQNTLDQVAENDAARTLMNLLLSLAEIAPAVEFYNQPAVIDGYDPRRFAADETFVMHPGF